MTESPMSSAIFAEDREMVFVGCGYLNKCPRDWGKLADINMPKQRHCTTCDRTVYRCDSEAEFRVHAQQEHCVAFSSSIFPQQRSLKESHYFGGAHATYETGGSLSWD